MSRQARWSVGFPQVTQKMKGDIEKVIRLSTFNLFQSVVNMSPVDTGRFRANWNVSYQQPDFSTTGDTSDTRGDSEAQKALSMLIGDVAYMCNGLPYAVRLEYGWSQQAPAGMVRISVADFKDYIAEAIAAKQ